MTDRRLLRWSATLLTAGSVAFFVVSLFHPGGVDPNDHPAVFAQYARSADWTAVHLGEFVGLAAVLGGLLLLCHALRARGGATRVAATIGAGLVGASLVLTAVRFAVDGVALRRAVDAWSTAPSADRPVRFADAEAVRWLEEAAGSYQSFLLGAASILLGVLVIRSATVPRPIGYVLAVSGLAHLAVGWVFGVDGFAPQGAIPTYVGQTCWLITGLWLLITTWRIPEPGRPALSPSGSTAG